MAPAREPQPRPGRRQGWRRFSECVAARVREARQCPADVSRRARRSPRRTASRRLVALLAVLTLALAGCAGAGAIGGGGDGVKTVNIAIISNPQMQDAISLVPEFEKANPGIRLKFVSLSENEARAKITASVATGGGEFDVVMISNYETPQWARNGWLTDLQPLADATPGYDTQDFLPNVRDALSYQGHMYSIPFYGESSFLMYRKDLFEQAGLVMPAKPTWQQVRDFAARLADPAKGQAGICLRGKPGWGELLAPLDTVINTFGGSWYDMQWNAQLNSPATERATQFYVDLLRDYGQPGGPGSGFSECATQFGQGNAAMWYDATVAASFLEDPKESKVVGKVGYVAAPVDQTQNSGWLYSWSLAMPKTTQNVNEAWRFISWMTSKEYMHLVGERLGWSRVPPGSRASTYQIPEYQQAAAAFMQPTLDAMNTADQNHPTVMPVPYTGLQFVGIPEFQDLGTRVSQQISGAIAEQQSVRDALNQSQQYAQTVGDTYRGAGQ